MFTNRTSKRLTWFLFMPLALSQTNSPIAILGPLVMLLTISLKWKGQVVPKLHLVVVSLNKVLLTEYLSFQCPYNQIVSEANDWRGIKRLKQSSWLVLLWSTRTFIQTKLASSNPRNLSSTVSQDQASRIRLSGYNERTYDPSRWLPSDKLSCLRLDWSYGPLVVVSIVLIFRFNPIYRISQSPCVEVSLEAMQPARIVLPISLTQPHYYQHHFTIWGSPYLGINTTW